MRDALPDVPDISDYYGLTIHHCPFCDAWEHRGQNIGVVGNDQAAADLALELLIWSSKVTLYNNAEAPLAASLAQCLRKNGVAIMEGQVEALDGTGGRLSRVSTCKGKWTACDAMFFSPAQAYQSALAKKLGCRTEPTF